MRPKKVLLAAALAVLAWALWYLSKPEVPLPGVPAGGTPVAESTGESLKLGPVAEPVMPAAPKPEAPAAKPGEVAAWEMKIDEALRSNAETAAIAQVLLQQIPTMPKEGQFAAAQHIVNLMPDKDYLSVMPYVRNTQLDPGFQEIVVAESLNRPDAVKLPLLLAAAQTPKHPMAEIAKSTLAFLLDGNFGEDWARWEAAIKESLAKQASQEASQ